MQAAAARKTISCPAAFDNNPLRASASVGEAINVTRANLLIHSIR
jgi:hypothetical protein